MYGLNACCSDTEKWKIIQKNHHTNNKIPPLFNWCAYVEFTFHCRMAFISCQLKRGEGYCETIGIAQSKQLQSKIILKSKKKRKYFLSFTIAKKWAEPTQRYLSHIIRRNWTNRCVCLPHIVWCLVRSLF